MTGVIEAKSLEQVVIEQLKGYKQLVARIKVLENYPIGYGMFLRSSNEDDKLQDLHRKLKEMPTYMYLSEGEQDLETIARSYLDNYPLGTKSQLHEVNQAQGIDAEDKIKLERLERKIKNVIDVRRGTVEGFEGVLERVSELQDLTSKKQLIDLTLESLGGYRPHFARLLTLRYIEDKPLHIVCSELHVSERTYRRWKQKAIEEYDRLMAA